MRRDIGWVTHVLTLHSERGRLTASALRDVHGVTCIGILVRGGLVGALDVQHTADLWAETAEAPI